MRAQSNEYLFNASNGLNSDNVFDVLLDSSDKVWITTNNGVHSYNGHNFKSFTTKDGLPTLFNWQMHRDESERIWLVSFETPFTYIKNNKVVRVGKKLNEFFTYNVVSSGDTVYLNSLRTKSCALVIKDSFIRILRDTVCAGFFNTKPLLKNRKTFMRGFEGISHFALNGKYLFQFGKRLDGLIIYRVRDVVTNKFVDLEEPHFGNSKLNSFSNRTKGTMVLNYQKGYSLVNTNVEYLKDVSFTSYPSADNLGCVISDKNHQTWKANLERGLLFEPATFNTHKFIKHPKGGKFVFSNLLDNDILVLVDDSKRFFYMDGESMVATNQIVTGFNSASEIISWNKHLVIVTGGRVHFFPLKKSTLMNLESLMRNPKRLNFDYLGRLRNGNRISIGSLKGYYKTSHSLTLTTGSAICYFSSDSNKIYKRPSEKRWTNHYVIKNRDTFICDHNGVSKKKGDLWEPVFNKEGVRSFFLVKDEIYFNSYSSKCYKLGESNQSIKEFKAFSHINKVYNIDSNIVVQNNNELYILTPSDLRVQENYSINTGFLAGKKLRYYKSKGADYLICAKGLYILPKDKKKASYQYKLRLDEAKLNGEAISIHSLKIKNKNDQLKLSFSINVYPKADGLVYEYRFTPNGSWQNSTSNEITFNGMPYDINGLEVQAIDDIGKQYGELLFIPLSNPTPYYKKGVFYLLVAFSFFLFMYLLMRRLEKKRILQLRKENEFLLNKQKMLGLQMRPHFLSNIFNNLQSSLLLDNPKETSNFVQQVNRYLRETLKASGLEFVTLAKEIEYVKNYINLERRRISKTINFKFSNEELLNLDDIQVPVFCLQPIIENAIWHGIQASENDKGQIHLDIQVQGDYYIISCADNGIGFNQSQKVGNSISLKNINKRMSLADAKRRANYFETGLSQYGGAKISLYVPRKPRYYNS